MAYKFNPVTGQLDLVNPAYDPTTDTIHVLKAGDTMTGSLILPAVTNPNGQGLFVSDGTAKILNYQGFTSGGTTYAFFGTNRTYTGGGWTGTGFYLNRRGATLQVENDLLAFYQFVANGTGPSEVFRIGTSGATLHTIQDPAIVGLTVKGYASQTANLTNWTDSANTVMTSIDPAGRLIVPIDGGITVNAGANNFMSFKDTAGQIMRLGRYPAWTDSGVTAWFQMSQLGGTHYAMFTGASGTNLDRMGIVSTTTVISDLAYNSMPVTSNTILHVQSSTATSAGIVVKGAASQSANLQEWKNSSGTVLAKVDSAGNITTPTITTNGGTSQLYGGSSTVAPLRIVSGHTPSSLVDGYLWSQVTKGIFYRDQSYTTNLANTAQLSSILYKPETLTTTSGSGTSTNLFTANEASVETDTTGFNSVFGAMTRDTTVGMVGTCSLKIVAASTLAVVRIGGTGTGAIPVTPSTTYTIQYWVRTTANAVAEVPSILIFTYDSGGTTVLNGNGLTIDYPVRLVANKWHLVTTTYTTGASEYYLRPEFRIVAAVNGQAYYFDAMGMWEGAGGTWSEGGTSTNMSAISKDGVILSQVDATGTQTNTGDFILSTAGKGIQIKEGTNAKMGTATLVAGTVTVSTTAVTANSRIFLTVQSLGTVTVPTAIAVTARTAGTSFDITSANVLDTSVVSWLLVEPA